MAHKIKLTRVGPDIRIEAPGDDRIRTLDARVAELFFGVVPGIEGQFINLTVTPPPPTEPERPKGRGRSAPKATDEE